MSKLVSCVICKSIAHVSPSWYAYNPIVCGKLCKKIFNYLSDDIKNQFRIVHDLEVHPDNPTFYDCGKYYSKHESYIEYEVTANGDLLQPLDDPYEEDDLRIWQDYNKWIIQNGNINYWVWHGKENYSRSLYLSDHIYPKISQKLIDSTIDELVQLERAVCLSSDIIKLCNSRNISTFFCISIPFQGFFRNK